jgi:hypothetical protein
MNQYQAIGFAFDLLAAGIERATILTKVQEWESSGRSAEEVANLIREMRNEALLGLPPGSLVIK